MIRQLKQFTATVAATLISSHAALAQSPAQGQFHAYEGPHRPLTQLATVHGTLVLNPMGRALTCQVDGKSIRGFVGCRLVVYLLPGKHTLQTYHYLGGIKVAYATITANLVAGRVYQIKLESTGGRVVSRLHEKPPGFVLTYKDLFPDSPLLSETARNKPVPTEE
jgi:hypothetical protein